jgi:hypothetical protein
MNEEVEHYRELMRAQSLTWGHALTVAARYESRAAHLMGESIMITRGIRIEQSIELLTFTVELLRYAKFAQERLRDSIR